MRDEDEAAAWGGETSSSSSEGVLKMEEEPRPAWMNDSVLPGTQRMESWDLSREQPDLDG